MPPLKSREHVYNETSGQRRTKHAQPPPMMTKESAEEARS
jgi:hypothetical protein